MNSLGDYFLAIMAILAQHSSNHISSPWNDKQSCHQAFNGKLSDCIWDDINLDTHVLMYSCTHVLMYIIHAVLGAGHLCQARRSAGHLCQARRSAWQIVTQNLQRECHALSFTDRWVFSQTECSIPWLFQTIPISLTFPWLYCHVATL